MRALLARWRADATFRDNVAFWGGWAVILGFAAFGWQR